MISRKDVEHIARLARIELSAAEAAKFERELSSILDFVNKLSEVHTAAIAPMAGGSDLVNVARADEPRRPVYQDEQGATLVEAAPRTRDSYIEVPAVFERE